MTPAPDAVSSGAEPFGVAVMKTTDGWMVLNTVSPTGGTFSAASTPLATSEVMVLLICSGVGVEGRSLDRIKASDARMIARATPAATSHDLVGRSRGGSWSSGVAGVSTRYSSKTRTSGCYFGGFVPSPRPLATCQAGRVQWPQGPGHEESAMRVVVNEFMSLDGVVQAPGGAEED